MILTKCNPERLLPYHPCYIDRLQPFPAANESRVSLPSIPVFEIPADLQYLPGCYASELADYVLYNGHHRRLAAIFAQVKEVDIVVLQHDADLNAIEPWELLNIPSAFIALHQQRVYKEVPIGTLGALKDQRALHRDGIAKGRFPPMLQEQTETN